MEPRIALRQHKSGERRFLIASIATSITALMLLVTYTFSAPKVGAFFFTLIMIGALMHIAASGLCRTLKLSE